MRYPRRNKLPRPNLQLKVVGAFLGVGVICAIFQHVILHRAIEELLRHLPGARAELVGETQEILARSFLWTLGLFVPLTVFVGVLVTFRIAGPLKRLEIYLRNVSNGMSCGPCRFRRGDELQDLAALLNQALEANSRFARERMEEEQARRRAASTAARRDPTREIVER